MPSIVIACSYQQAHCLPHPTHTHTKVGPYAHADRNTYNIGQTCHGHSREEGGGRERACVREVDTQIARERGTEKERKKRAAASSRRPTRRVLVSALSQGGLGRALTKPQLLQGDQPDARADSESKSWSERERASERARERARERERKQEREHARARARERERVVEREQERERERDLDRPPARSQQKQLLGKQFS